MTACTTHEVLSSLGQNPTVDEVMRCTEIGGGYHEWRFSDRPAIRLNSSDLRLILEDAYQSGQSAYPYWVPGAEIAMIFGPPGKPVQSNAAAVKRIAVTITKKSPLNPNDLWEPPQTRPAWMTEHGALYYRDVPDAAGPHHEYTLIPPPRQDVDVWERARTNYTVLALRGGRGFTIRRENGAEWQECSGDPWAES